VKGRGSGAEGIWKEKMVINDDVIPGLRCFIAVSVVVVGPDPFAIGSWPWPQTERRAREGGNA